MNVALVKTLALICIFLGEALAIYQELLAARAAKTTGFTWVLGGWLLFWMIISGVLLLAGYFLGYLTLKNIWVVTVVSIGSIVILEPVLVVLFFHETPTIGAWIGLVLAVAAIIISMVF